MNWTPEQDDQLRSLWGTGDLSATGIGAIFGVTKNAVLGRAYRLKFPPKVAAKIVTITKPRSDKGRAHNGYRQRIKKAPPVKNDVPRPKPVPEFEVDLVALKAPAWLPLEGTTPVLLVDLTAHSCRWPVDQGDGPQLFCGCTTATGSSWCATHKRKSIGTGTESERAAHRARPKQIPSMEMML